MPDRRSREELAQVRQELIELLDNFSISNSSLSERSALEDTIDDLTAALWRANNEPAND
ncbi:hypothetical protein [Caulobacter mirabilis]|uniref:hypothetical protein n=1 Tax=Caulobacter mirabilis TaxID=69666 RepID=UPI0015585106|nr:hypothetical protein [Caulobacter mirabilis]